MGAPDDHQFSILVVLSGYSDTAPDIYLLHVLYFKHISLCFTSLFHTYVEIPKVPYGAGILLKISITNDITALLRK